jgi:hypothetical protein
MQDSAPAIVAHANVIGVQIVFFTSKGHKDLVRFDRRRGNLRICWQCGEGLPERWALVGSGETSV